LLLLILIWQIGFIAGEVQLPEKNLPAIINTAMPIVIVSFVGINLALFAVLDKESLSSTNAVAVVSLSFCKSLKTALPRSNKFRFLEIKYLVQSVALPSLLWSFYRVLEL
jgi:hypothetical protein